ncbi:PAS domain S-box protein [Fodinibius saliphilus]|uniref:PAS domain S-box protein n=1 Tax=Fodinibius saliphilus TaxID=1920650 RepID=UPI001107CD22|nr:PAS domain S-box protein [Fodinibius saliphilus]
MRENNSQVFSKETIDKFFSSGSVILFTCEKKSDFPLLSVSKNSKTILGFEPSYFLEGKDRWSERIHPEDRERVLCHFEKVFEEGEEVFNEYRFKRKDGTYIWLRDELKLIESPKEEETFIYGSSIDITERKKVRLALQESKEQYPSDLREEIKKRKQAEKELQQRLLYEQALSKCSSLLLEHTNHGALEESLKILRDVTQSDRVYIFRNVEIDDKLCLKRLIEVSEDGTEIPQVPSSELVSYAEVPWWYHKLSNGEIINARVDDLSHKEGVLLKERDVNSVLVIPISIGEEWYGYIGFADTEKDDLWEENEVRLLQTAADIISAYKKRKKIEVNLLEQKNYTEAILNSLPGIYLLMDEDLENVQWNSNTSFFTSYTDEELAKRSGYDLIATEHHDRLTEAKEKIHNNEGSGFELTLLTKMGKKIPYYWRGYYIQLNKNYYYLWVGIDITQQKETEQALVEEKRFNEALVETLPGSFFMIGEDAEYKSWNQNLSDELEYSNSELEEISPLSLFPKKEHRTVVGFMNKVFKKGEASVELSCLTKSGKEIPYLITGKLFEQEGRNYLLGVGHNITEQVEARKKLKRNENLFRNLFLQAPSAIVMVTPDNKIKDVNQSFENLFGYSKEEITGRDIDKVLVPEEELEEAPTMPGKGFKAMASFHREAQRRASDGSLVDVFVAGIPVFVDGKPIAGFGMYIDITEQKKYEKEIYNSLKEKHVLLQEIHHRVKNNLAVVSGLIQLQMYETDDKEVRETLKESESRVQTMALIHEKLYKSQSLSQISCQSYIGDLVETIRSTNNTLKDITIDKEIDAVMLSINQAVPFALLINEVVTNAFKHAFERREQGNIQIKLEAEDGRVHLYIKDNGIGLPDDFNPQNSDSLGMTLIYNFMDQLEAEGEMGTDNGTYLTLSFSVKDINGSSASSLLSSSYGM